MRPGFSDQEIAQIFSITVPNAQKKISGLCEKIYKMWKADPLKAQITMMHFFRQYEQVERDEMSEAEISQRVARLSGRANH